MFLDRRAPALSAKSAKSYHKLSDYALYFTDTNN